MDKVCVPFGAVWCLVKVKWHQFLHQHPEDKGTVVHSNQQQVSGKASVRELKLQYVLYSVSFNSAVVGLCHGRQGQYIHTSTYLHTLPLVAPIKAVQSVCRDRSAEEWEWNNRH